MKRSTLVAVITLCTLLASGTALADKGRHGGEGHRYDNVERGRHGYSGHGREHAKGRRQQRHAYHHRHRGGHRGYRGRGHHSHFYDYHALAGGIIGGVIAHEVFDHHGSHH